MAHNQIEVARRFGIDRTVMVRLVDEMERAGLVRRRPAPTDRRARMIVPTELGIRAHQRARDALRTVDDHVLAPLSPAEREAFAAMAHRVSEHLVAMDPTRGAAACVAAEETLNVVAAAAGACGVAAEGGAGACAGDESVGDGSVGGAAAAGGRGGGDASGPADVSRRATGRR
ncbi:MarR family transcriptional regulator [Frankia sp. EI5c]|uniref:MarR family winged helix-turn-helix transcriptional regulator n=1 Tax=Frankia sp. EI5c TaxID=683316 RepID=UPI0028C4E2E6|nr:MarR family transcriptional regulator [Frankia sp. EI5c]